MPASDRKVPVTHSNGKLDRQEIERNYTDLFAKFAEQIDSGISTTDEEGRIIFWNRALAALTGLSAQQTMGEFIWDVYFSLLAEASRTSQNLTRLKKTFATLLESGHSEQQDPLAEYNYLRSDGEQLTLRGTIYAVSTEQGYSLFSLSEHVSTQKLGADILKASEEKFRNVVEQANDAIIIFDQDEIVLEWNMGCERISGLKREDVIGKRLSEVVPDIFRPQEWGDEESSFSVHDVVLKNLEEILQSGSPRFVEGHILNHADGDRRWVQSVTFPIQAGSLKLFGSISRDLSEVKQTENRLQRYTHQLETLRQAGLEIAAELGLDSLVWMIAPRAIEMLNGTAMALYLYDAEKDILDLAISLGENQPEIEKTAQRGKSLAGHVWETGKAILLEDYHTGRTADLEKKYWGKVVGAPIIWGMDFLGVLFVFSDQAFYETDLKILELFTAHAAAAIRNARLHQQLSRLAITDSLTGIFNRRHFFELAELEFQESLRYDRPFSVLMFDLDLFKQVNDTHGHSRGDEILRTVVQRCATTIRNADILARYGGEEFVVALPQTGAKKASALADRLRQVICATPIETEKGPLTVTVSFGVSTLSSDMNKLMQLLNRADMALYQSKRSGRNRVCVWTDALNTTLPDNWT